MTLEEVGEVLGVTRERARQLERDALKKLRRYARQYPEIRDWLEEKIGRHDCRVLPPSAHLTDADMAAFRAAPGAKGHFRDSFNQM